MRDITCFRGGLRGERCKKFEVNQTDLKRVILPTDSSASSGDLRSDVSLMSGDVRPDMTTKLLVGYSSTKRFLYLSNPYIYIYMYIYIYL
jgi:hypothetical protein